MENVPYIIRGGAEGRERLRVLARIMRPTSLALLNRAGLRPGMACLDIGSGGGDLAFDLAQLVGPDGWVVGTDIDDTKIEIARAEAKALGLTNVEFRVVDVQEDQPRQEFDLVHARFILTHLPHPERALAHMFRALRPGGIAVIEDIDFSGYFSYPDCPAVLRYAQLYTQAAKRRGGDANIGPRLPELLTAAHFENIEINIVQPVGTDGEVKMLSPLTMEFIADAVVAEGLASQTEIDRLVKELYEFARTPNTVGCGPRVFEAWGHRA